MQSSFNVQTSVHVIYHINRLRNIAICFLLKVLCFTFKSVCYFELIFVYHVTFRGRLTSWIHLELETQEGDEMQRLGGQEGAQDVSRVLGRSVRYVVR